MSGAELKEAQKSAQCAVQDNGTHRYTTHYLVRMTNAKDGPGQVLNYARGRGVGYGYTYNYGNEADVGATCVNIQASRMPGSTEWWDLTAVYEPRRPGAREDDEGQPSNRPQDWRWSIDMGYATWQEPVWNAWNRTEFPHPYQIGNVTGVEFRRPANTYGPVVNSANVVLDPPLMRDVYDLVFRMTTYSLFYDATYAQNYMGVLNEVGVRFSDYIKNAHNLSDFTFAQYTLKCSNVSATAKVHEYDDGGYVRVPYWEWDWEFRYREYTWNDHVLDRGITCLSSNATVTGSQSPQEPVLDSSSRRVPEMVLFDGKGSPMQPTDAYWQDSGGDAGYYFLWQKDLQNNFADIPFDFFTQVA